MASYSIFSEEAMMAMPTLNPDDVAAAAIYVLSNPPHVVVRLRRVYRPSVASHRTELRMILLLQVQDIVLRPLGESW